MEDILTLIISIFVVLSIYWQYHSYTNTNSLLYRIKKLEEKLSEQQEKLFKLLNRDNSTKLGINTRADRSSDEKIPHDVIKEPNSITSQPDTIKSATEYLKGQSENRETPQYQRVSQETEFDKVSPKETKPTVQSSLVNENNTESNQSNKQERATALSSAKPEPEVYQPKISTSRFARHYQKEPKQTHVDEKPNSLSENTANIHLSASQSDLATVQDKRPASQYRPALNPRRKHQQKSLFGLIWNWVITGNPLAKIGMLLLFFGLSYLLKYSIENELISASTRLVMAGSGCFALLGIGWWLRKKNLIYALILQGGGIGGLYITIFAATKIYDFIPIGIALAIMVFICLVSVALAVIHRAISLAVLASLGGYLAPILLSTGSGNYVALFSYYLILSIGILIISHWQVWRLLNLIGFVFTFGIGFMWAIPNYTHADYFPCQLFLIANWFIFGVATEMSTLKNKLKLNLSFDATLLFGTPLIGFIFQYRLASEWEYGVAIASSLYALAYFALCWFTLKRYREEGKLLAIAFFMLSATFATLAVPFAFSADWTSMVWAIEGVMILGFSVLQQQNKPAIAGTTLIAISLVLLLIEPIAYLNEWVMLIAQVVIVFAAATLWYRAKFKGINCHFVGFIILSIAVVVWLYSLLLLQGYGEYWFIAYIKAITFVLILISCWLMYFVGRKTHFSELASCSVLLWPASVLIMLFYLSDVASLIHNVFSAITWVAIFISGFYLLKFNTLLPKQRVKIPLIHATHLIFIGMFLLTEMIWVIYDYYLLISIHFASAFFAVSLFIALSYILATRVSWVKLYQNIYWAISVPVFGLLMLLLVFANLTSGADIGYTFIPLFNPMDLMGIVALWVGYKFVILIKQQPKYQEMLKNNLTIVNYLIPAMVFWWANGVLLRGLVSMSDIDWNYYAILNSKVIQTVLAIVWTITALVMMIMATRKKSRSQWFIGGALLAVVIAKLFLIDISLSSGLLRASAFIGVAVLILFIGYFSPLPPKKNSATEPVSS